MTDKLFGRDLDVFSLKRSLESDNEENEPKRKQKKLNMEVFFKTDLTLPVKDNDSKLENADATQTRINNEDQAKETRIASLHTLEEMLIVKSSENSVMAESRSIESSSIEHSRPGSPSESGSSNDEMLVEPKNIPVQVHGLKNVIRKPVTEDNTRNYHTMAKIVKRNSSEYAHKCIVPQPKSSVKSESDFVNLSPFDDVSEGLYKDLGKTLVDAKEIFEEQKCDLSKNAPNDVDMKEPEKECKVSEPTSESSESCDLNPNLKSNPHTFKDVNDSESISCENNFLTSSCTEKEINLVKKIEVKNVIVENRGNPKSKINKCESKSDEKFEELHTETENRFEENISEKQNNIEVNLNQKIDVIEGDQSDAIDGDQSENQNIIGDKFFKTRKDVNFNHEELNFLFSPCAENATVEKASKVEEKIKNNQPDDAKVCFDPELDFVTSPFVTSPFVEDEFMKKEAKVDPVVHGPKHTEELQINPILRENVRDPANLNISSNFAESSFFEQEEEEEELNIYQEEEEELNIYQEEEENSKIESRPSFISPYPDTVELADENPSRKRKTFDREKITENNENPRKKKKLNPEPAFVVPQTKLKVNLGNENSSPKSIEQKNLNTEEMQKSDGEDAFIVNDLVRIRGLKPHIYNNLNGRIGKIIRHFSDNRICKYDVELEGLVFRLKRKLLSLVCHGGNVHSYSDAAALFKQRKDKGCVGTVEREEMLYPCESMTHCPKCNCLYDICEDLDELLLSDPEFYKDGYVCTLCVRTNPTWPLNHCAICLDDICSNCKPLEPVTPTIPHSEQMQFPIPVKIEPAQQRPMMVAKDKRKKKELAPIKVKKENVKIEGGVKPRPAVGKKKKKKKKKDDKEKKKPKKWGQKTRNIRRFEPIPLDEHLADIKRKFHGVEKQNNGWKVKRIINGQKFEIDNHHKTPLHAAVLADAICIECEQFNKNKNNQVDGGEWIPNFTKQKYFQVVTKRNETGKWRNRQTGIGICISKDRYVICFRNRISSHFAPNPASSVNVLDDGEADRQFPSHSVYEFDEESFKQDLSKPQPLFNNPQISEKKGKKRHGKKKVGKNGADVCEFCHEVSSWYLCPSKISGLVLCSACRQYEYKYGKLVPKDQRCRGRGIRSKDKKSKRKRKKKDKSNCTIKSESQPLVPVKVEVEKISKHVQSPTILQNIPIPKVKKEKKTLPQNPAVSSFSTIEEPFPKLMSSDATMQPLVLSPNSSHAKIPLAPKVKPTRKRAKSPIQASKFKEGMTIECLSMNHLQYSEARLIQRNVKTGKWTIFWLDRQVISHGHSEKDMRLHKRPRLDASMKSNPESVAAQKKLLQEMLEVKKKLESKVKEKKLKNLNETSTIMMEPNLNNSMPALEKDNTLEETTSIQQDLSNKFVDPNVISSEKKMKKNNTSKGEPFPYAIPKTKTFIKKITDDIFLGDTEDPLESSIVPHFMGSQNKILTSTMPPLSPEFPKSSLPKSELEESISLSISRDQSKQDMSKLDASSGEYSDVMMSSFLLPETSKSTNFNSLKRSSPMNSESILSTLKIVSQNELKITSNDNDRNSESLSLSPDVRHFELSQESFILPENKLMPFSKGMVTPVSPDLDGLKIPPSAFTHSSIASPSISRPISHDENFSNNMPENISI